MNATLRKFQSWIAASCAVLLVAGLFVGGAQPVAVNLIPAPWDKVVHAGFFLVLTLLLWQALGGRLGLAVVLAILLGGLDEFQQAFLPGRYMGLDDWLADAAGVGLAAVLICRWKCRRN